MVHRSIAQQVLVEHEILNHVMNALRTILDWKIQEHDLSRKLTSLLFITQSFQRHLNRVIDLEESDVYPEMVNTLHPLAARQIPALKRDHDQFQTMLGRIMPRLERISSIDHATMGMMCDELRVLLTRLSEHSGKEAELIERAQLAECAAAEARQALPAF